MQGEGADFLGPSDWEPMEIVLGAVLVSNCLVGWTSKKILYPLASNLQPGCQTRILNASHLPDFDISIEVAADLEGVAVLVEKKVQGQKEVYYLNGTLAVKDAEEHQGAGNPH